MIGEGQVPYRIGRLLTVMPRLPARGRVRGRGGGEPQPVPRARGEAGEARREPRAAPSVGSGDLAAADGVEETARRMLLRWRDSGERSFFATAMFALANIAVESTTHLSSKVASTKLS